MLTIKHGDVFEELKAGDVFVHGCNSKGVMGSGVAKIVKERFPKVYEAYMNCDKNRALGTFSCEFIDGIMYVNAVTQENYGRDTSTVYVDYDSALSVMMQIKSNAFLCNFHRVVFPFIGGGLANGDRKILLDIFHEVFDNSPIEGVLVIND